MSNEDVFTVTRIPIDTINELAPDGVVTPELADAVKEMFVASFDNAMEYLTEELAGGVE